MSDDNEFSISVAELDAGGKPYDFVVRAAWVRGAMEGHEATTAGKDGTLVVRASKSGHDVIVHGTLDADLSVPCARCLEPFVLPVHADLSVIFVPSSRLRADGQGSKEDAELDATEADTLPFVGDTVVLDDLVRDELVLEVPMTPLCSDACPGISPAPDKGSPPDKPIDPRLLPLLELGAKKGEPSR